jgi:hypothetical protein
MPVTAALFILALSTSAVDTAQDTPNVYLRLLNQVYETYTDYQKGYETVSGSKAYSWRVVPPDSFPYACSSDSIGRCREVVSLGSVDSSMCRDSETPLRVRVVVMVSVTRKGRTSDRVYRMMFFEYRGFWDEWRPLVQATMSACPAGYGCQQEY